MIEIVRNRRTIRKYTPTPVEPEKIELLKEALLRSPTGRNKKAWKFWFVTDEALLSELGTAKKSGSALIAGAPLAVVIGTDTTTTDVWIEDCSIAAIILQLTAQSLGLGSCWVQIRLRENSNGESSQDHVRRALNISGSTAIEAIISIGYPAEVRTPVEASELSADVIVDL